MFGRSFSCLRSLLSVATAAVALVSASSAQVSEQPIFSFSGLNGQSPLSRLVQDSQGRLYGTSQFGGNQVNPCSSLGCGLVFAIAPNSAGGWNYHGLYAFTGGADGSLPGARLVFDAAGNLYGISQGGVNNKGVVFKLSPGTSGHWTATVIYSFGSSGTSDGDGPTDGLTIDAAGNLYGTTGAGGTHGFGTVFKLTPASGGSWSESILYAFPLPTDGCDPVGGVVFDGAGNLYGATTFCGAMGAGNIFEISPQSSGAWTENILFSFGSSCCTNYSTGPLLLDAAGNIYGNGLDFGNGYIFQLVKNSDGSWSENNIYTFFSIQDGSEPSGGLVFDKKGNLYGTTAQGGAEFGNGNGVVYQLRKNSDGTWTGHVLYAFAAGSDGKEPLGGVTIGRGNVIYGTTQNGGPTDQGTVFRLTP